MPRPLVRSPFLALPETRPPCGDEEPVAFCLVAETMFERALHYRIRREVFVGEQGFFPVDDRDARDAEPATVHVLGLFGEVAAGAVRLYPLDEPGLWKGDRLAVLPAFRHRHVGAPLVRFAVHTAGARGGRRMMAHIQPQNVPFFARLGWRSVGETTTYVGRPHQQMTINLT